LRSEFSATFASLLVMVDPKLVSAARFRDAALWASVE
jgi:hypothetical protein